MKLIRSFSRKNSFEIYWPLINKLLSIFQVINRKFLPNHSWIYLFIKKQCWIFFTVLFYYDLLVIRDFRYQTLCFSAINSQSKFKIAMLSLSKFKIAMLSLSKFKILTWALVTVGSRRRGYFHVACFDEYHHLPSSAE